MVNEHHISTAGRFPGAFIRSESLHVSSGENVDYWSVDRAVYHISLHLSDSIPAAERASWHEIRAELSAVKKTRALTPDELALLKSAYSEKIEHYLQAGCGECWLRDQGVASAVLETLEHDHGRTYELHLVCIMPNHIHLIAAFEQGVQMRAALTAWKRITSHKINGLLGRTGAVWMDDAYTRIIRTVDEYERQMSYVRVNPEVAGLSSGFLMKSYG